MFVGVKEKICRFSNLLNQSLVCDIFIWVWWGFCCWGFSDLTWRAMWRGLEILCGRERTRRRRRLRWWWPLCSSMGLLVLARLLWMNSLLGEEYFWNSLVLYSFLKQLFRCDLLNALLSQIFWWEQVLWNSN